MKRIARYSQFTRLLAVAVLLLSTAPFASAQQLGMEVTYMPVHRLSPADVDFERAGGTNLLFTLRIQNPTTNPIDAQLFGILTVDLGRNKFNGEGASFTSRPFTVPPGMKIVTNFDLNRNGNIGLTESEIAPAFKPYVDDGLATGLMPEGRYAFEMRIRQIGGVQDDATVSVILTLKNTSRVDLRSPRDGESTNEFPFFEYSFDGDRATLRVAELGEGQSREDALARRPLMLEADVTGNSYMYLGGRPLENGKTYVWQMTVDQALMGGGASSVESPVWAFTVTGVPNGRSESPILHQLEEIFGARYPAIFEAIRSGGFSPSGSFVLNGTPISQSDLLDLLNQLRAKADTAELTFE